MGSTKEALCQVQHLFTPLAQESSLKDFCKVAFIKLQSPSSPVVIKWLHVGFPVFLGLTHSDPAEFRRFPLPFRSSADVERVEGWGKEGFHHKIRGADLSLVMVLRSRTPRRMATSISSAGGSSDVGSVDVGGVGVAPGAESAVG